MRFLYTLILKAPFKQLFQQYFQFFHFFDAYFIAQDRAHYWKSASQLIKYARFDPITYLHILYISEAIFQ